MTDDSVAAAAQRVDVARAELSETISELAAKADLMARVRRNPLAYAAAALALAVLVTAIVRGVRR
jgi:hypothetical protein